MRFLILSDLHANWEALQAVLGQASGHYDRVLCCGDIVGYGADPDAVTEWVRQNAASVVRGNHDRACTGLEDLEWFNPVARVSALWTQANTKPGNVAYLRDLPPGPVIVGGLQILHGSPLDEDEYLISEHDAAQVFPYIDYALSFFGHTHVQGGFQCDRRSLWRIPAQSHEDLELHIEPDMVYMVNPGSVGQPRDSDPRAAYAIYDLDNRVVTYHRVTYDIAAAGKKIISARLPEVLAKRLESGY